MEPALIGVVLGQAGSIIAGIVWAIRQEGRINSHDLRFEMTKQLNDERQMNVVNALQRIETKLDRKADDVPKVVAGT